ncbi:MAG: hypothetical protein M3P49_12360, partial [Actinomycetota bacterium]|nr:hypothetical protein [Actinomycetota bacterium]
QSRALAPLARENPQEAARVWGELVTEKGDASKVTSKALSERAMPAISQLREAQRAGTPVSGEPDPAAVLAANADRVLGWHQGGFQKFVGEAHGLHDRSISLLLADPPYGKGYASRHSAGHEPIKDDGDPRVAAKALDEMLELFAPKLKDDAHVVIFCDPRHEPVMRAVVEKYEKMPDGSGEDYLAMRSFAVWSKGGAGQGYVLQSFAPTHERMIHATKGLPGFAQRPADVLRHQKVSTRAHPTRKPLALLEEIILALTVPVPGAPPPLVADPFGGSGSTLVAAIRTGRRAWGAEFEPGYHATGQDRIARAVLSHGGARGNAPEIATQVPKKVHERFAGLAARPPAPEDSAASPLLLPDHRDRLSPLVLAWLRTLGGRRSVLVEPYTEDGDSALRSLSNLLTERAVLAGGDPRASAFWRVVLAGGQTEGTNRPTGPSRLVADMVEGFEFSKRGLAGVAGAAPESLAGDEERAFATLVRSRVSGAESPDAPSWAWRWDVREIVGRLWGLGNAAARGEAEFREASAMDVLGDKDLAGDPDAAFFVDVPEGEASGRLLGALRDVAGPFLAVVDEERHLRRAARERGLDARRLPFEGRPDRLLVGRDLSWLDEGLTEVEMTPLFGAENPAP